MTRASILMFALGVVVTVAVYEVTGLRLRASGAQPLAAAAAPKVVAAAASVTERAAPADRRAARPVPAAPAASGAVSEEEAAALRARAAFAETRAEASEGRESPWPASVAPEFRKDAVEQQLKEFIVDRGLAKIDRMDCSEYPCVSVLKLPVLGSEARSKVHEALNEMIKARYGGHVALSISSSQTGSGSDAISMAGVSIMPRDEDVMLRTRHRTQIEMQDGGR